ncbi:hypothetical protein VA603_01210, partial [Stenotrophomonas sp. MH1]
VVSCPYAFKRCGLNQKLGGAGRARFGLKHTQVFVFKGFLYTETLCTTGPERVGNAVDNFPRFWRRVFIHNFPNVCPRIMHRFVR